MKLCVPYSEKHLLFLSCAAKTFGIEFVAPPKAGKYTLEIGEAFATQKMSKKQIEELGSCAECCYLGADSVLICDDADNCPERTAALIRNSLINNNLKMNVQTVAYAQPKELFNFFKENGALSYKDYLETKRNFYGTLELEAQFDRQKRKLLLQGDTRAEAFIGVCENNISLAKDLLDLKLLYRLHLKRLKVAEKPSVLV